jgi:Tfp pilus assembly protein PilX
MAAIMFTMTVLAIVTIITLFTARVIVTDHKIYGNVQNNAAALNAAQAGFDYALGYLNAYPYIVANGLGYCAAATNTYALTSGTLANGATYTMTFSCITAGDFVTFNLTAVGTSADSTATRTLTGTLRQYCGISQPLITRTTATLNNTSVLSNTLSGATRAIDAGGTVRLNNTSSVTTTTGGNCPAVYTSPAATSCLSIRSSNATPATTALSTISNANFQQLYLGRQLTGFSTLATVYNINCAGGGMTKTFYPTTTFSSLGCTNSGTGGVAGTLNGISGAII